MTTTTRTVATIAALTLREASRRRVLLALALGAGVLQLARAALDPRPSRATPRAMAGLLTLGVVGAAGWGPAPLAAAAARHRRDALRKQHQELFDVVAVDHGDVLAIQLHLDAVGHARQRSGPHANDGRDPASLAVRAGRLRCGRGYCTAAGAVSAWPDGLDGGRRVHAALHARP